MSRKSRLLRFPPSVDEILTGYAEDNDLTINEAAVVAVGLLKVGEQVLVNPDTGETALESEFTKTVTIKSPPPPEDVEDGERMEHAQEVRIRCTHPRPMRKRLGYLTLCDPDQGGCGRPVSP